MSSPNATGSRLSLEARRMAKSVISLGMREARIHISARERAVLEEVEKWLYAVQDRYLDADLLD